MEIETVVVDSDQVYCEGNGPALGHPRVFLRIGEEGEVTCPYCSRHFVLREKAEALEAEG